MINGILRASGVCYNRLWHGEASYFILFPVFALRRLDALRRGREGLRTGSFDVDNRCPKWYKRDS